MVKLSNTIISFQRTRLLLSSSGSQLVSKKTYSISSSTTTEASTASSSYSPALLPVRPPTSNHTKPTPQINLRLGAAALLSRSPLLLRRLTEFENSYYQYQRELHRALSKPIKSSFFFRPGSHAAKAFESSIQSSLEIHPLFSSENHPTDSNHTQQSPDPIPFDNIQRAPTRFIYLLFKLVNPSNLKSIWQLPTSKIIGSSDDLTQASLRSVYTNAGPDMDIWSIGKVPATVYNSNLDSDSRFDKVWVMPQRILRGQPKLLKNSKIASSSITTPLIKENDDENLFQVQDFGWFCSEEIKQRVHLDLWNALEPVLK